jgi:hypothetical protein
MMLGKLGTSQYNMLLEALPKLRAGLRSPFMIPTFVLPFALLMCCAENDLS